MKRFLFSPSLFVALFAVLPAVPAQTGTKDLQMKVGKAERDYRLHVPKSYGKSKAAKVPLVLMLHGRGSSGE